MLLHEKLIVLLWYLSFLLEYFFVLFQLALVAFRSILRCSETSCTIADTIHTLFEFSWEITCTSKWEQAHRTVVWCCLSTSATQPILWTDSILQSLCLLIMGKTSILYSYFILLALSVSVYPSGCNVSVCMICLLDYLSMYESFELGISKIRSLCASCMYVRAHTEPEQPLRPGK